MSKYRSAHYIIAVCSGWKPHKWVCSRSISGKDAMYPSRRAFIGASLSLAASTAAVWAAQQGQQSSPPFAPPQQPEPIPVRGPKRDRAMLKANREAIAKDVTRMSELVDELQKQLKENDTTDVLSIDVLRKSEEIEKLAKQVRELVRG
jgi:hypothetical protein